VFFSQHITIFEYKFGIGLLVVGEVEVYTYRALDLSSLTTVSCPFPAAHDSGV
jgi:hypothetical protein